MTIRPGLLKVREIKLPHALGLVLQALAVATWGLWLRSEPFEWSRLYLACGLMIVLTKVVIQVHELCHLCKLLWMGIPPAHIEGHSLKFLSPYMRIKDYLLTRTQMVAALEAPTAPPFYPMVLVSIVGLLWTMISWWCWGFSNWPTLVGLILVPALFYSLGDTLQRRRVLQCEPT